MRKFTRLTGSDHHILMRSYKHDRVETTIHWRRKQIYMRVSTTTVRHSYPVNMRVLLEQTYSGVDEIGLDDRQLVVEFAAEAFHNPDIAAWTNLHNHLRNYIWRDDTKYLLATTLPPDVTPEILRGIHGAGIKLVAPALISCRQRALMADFAGPVHVVKHAGELPDE